MVHIKLDFENTLLEEKARAQEQSWELTQLKDQLSNASEKTSSEKIGLSRQLAESQSRAYA